MGAVAVDREIMHGNVVVLHAGLIAEDPGDVAVPSILKPDSALPHAVAVDGDVVVEHDGAERCLTLAVDDISPCWNIDGAAARRMGGIHGRLDGRCVVRGAVTRGPKIPDVVNHVRSCN